MEDFFDLKTTIGQIASDNRFKPAAVKATIALLDEGNTIPFIARYRKEATLGLDETAIRRVEDEVQSARTLATRKKSILAAIRDQDALTESLEKQIVNCRDLNLLENLYLPFKKKRRTRATIAKEAGLEPLADLILDQQRVGRPRAAILKSFVNSEKGIDDPEAAIAGAGHIIGERLTQDASLCAWLFEAARDGRLTSKVKRGKKESGAKFENYYDFSQPLKRVASHQFLAIKRGQDEGFLNLSIDLDDEHFLRNLRRRYPSQHDCELSGDLDATLETAWTAYLHPAASRSVLSQASQQAQTQAIEVFAANARQLLLAPPAGKKVTMGIDPGFRTGCKVAVVDATGKFLANKTIFPTAPKNDTRAAEKTVLGLIEQHAVELIAIGNGTASRETDAFVAGVIRRNGLKVTKAIVSESGASIYSASEVAIAEYPDLDVTVRGAISIAHRLQDPLAELVKVDPKSIGVGQYQHDVNQAELKRTLDREVESCVSSVGVELNTASQHLLGYVAGIGPKMASQIVAWRDSNGQYRRKRDLMSVPRLGEKVFQQAAGFLRIADGDDPLDDSAVHPECHAMVRKMARSLDLKVPQVIGNKAAIETLKAEDFVDETFGLPTVNDVFEELLKPGRDPRQSFQTVVFDDSVNSMSDLREGMNLQGQVSNVTAFGAFVDIGVHQDGLVHVSQMADHYVSDPAEVVKVGDVVRVRVVSVDEKRKRIGLSMRSEK